jgi:alkanesulfonate monooxygenase SsuD/methylene tetrahydromethanopterin reductase-like flavin-dependent oxidoreductase (luciferase family)
MIVGTGEAMNERPFLAEWPKWKTRAEMLVEAVDLMRKYWSSEEYFSFKGKYFNMDMIMCYDRSPSKIPVYFSAYGPKAALIAGEHADGLCTWGTKFDYTKNEILPNFEKGARAAGRDPKSLLKIAWVDIGFGEQKTLLDKFRKSSASWFIEANYDEPDPRKTEKNAYSMTDEEIRKMAIITDDPEDFVKIVERDERDGFDVVIFSDSSLYPEQTVAEMKRAVIPHFKSK